MGDLDHALCHSPALANRLLARFVRTDSQRGGEVLQEVRKWREVGGGRTLSLMVLKVRPMAAMITKTDHIGQNVNEK